jgi:hypothetical protein
MRAWIRSVAELLPVLLAALLCQFSLIAPAIAGPTDAVTVTLPPDGQGDAFVPGVRLVEDLPREYVEEEFFVEGAASIFSYAHNPPLGPTDLATVAEDVPYKTRIVVRRPANPEKFNGTVVVEWWNSTAGFDTAPVWDPSAEYFADSGVIYVGVTNSTTSLNFLKTGCRLLGFLPPSCGTRYASLALFSNGMAFEMMSQIANLLRSDDPSNPIPEDYVVEQLLHAGESQQAGSVVTYASAFHLSGVNDGYFIQSGINARPINFGPACGSAGAPAFPACTPRLEFPDSLVRTDLPVPVYQTVTQTDFEELGFNVFGRQADTPTFRYYEIAGAAHSTVHENIELIPAGVFGPDPVLLEDLCANQINTVADGPVFGSFAINALWERMQEQVAKGAVPPAGIVMDDVAGVLQRDANGNVLGGVRLPSMAVPLARYGSTNTADPGLPPVLSFIGGLACRLSGSVFPFDAATLDALYPTHGGYVNEVSEATDALKAQGLMLQSDAARVKKAAAKAEVGN